MKVGVAYPQIELEGNPEAFRRFGLATEELGYDHLLMYDHVVGAVHEDRQPPLPDYAYTERDPFHDPLVAFGYLAALTTRIELITGILILPQRQTALVARQAADVDLLSGGRLRLGVGIGYNPVEYQTMGEQFTRRGLKLTEQIPYLRRLWSEQDLTFSGEFHQIERANLVPRPNNAIPIWCGGFSESAFRRAAQMGDGFIFGYGFSDAATGAWSRVQELLREEGRPVEGFRALVNLHSGASVSSIGDALLRLRDADVTDVTVASTDLGFTDVEQHVDFIAEVKAHSDQVLC